MKCKTCGHEPLITKHDDGKRIVWCPSCQTETTGISSNALDDNTLRDQFAIAALMTRNGSIVGDEKACAAWCYEMADAMMEAREK